MDLLVVRGGAEADSEFKSTETPPTPERTHVVLAELTVERESPIRPRWRRFELGNRSLTEPLSGLPRGVAKPWGGGLHGGEEAAGGSTTRDQSRGCAFPASASRLFQLMSYRDPLPAACPPDAAEEIVASRPVFRLVRTDPPTPDDFLSQRQERPGHAFSGVPECVACGWSVFADKDDAVAMARKLPRPRNRRICRVTLVAGAGRTQRTFQRSHETWWPMVAFDILAHCGVEAV